MSRGYETLYLITYNVH